MGRGSLHCWFGMLGRPQRGIVGNRKRKGALLMKVNSVILFYLFFHKRILIYFEEFEWNDDEISVQLFPMIILFRE
jgi:hypothetical protein